MFNSQSMMGTERGKLSMIPKGRQMPKMRVAVAIELEETAHIMESASSTLA
jgi:hypothetical protein